MKHATQQTIKGLEPVLQQISRLPGLVEKKPGVYYLKSKAFLHFHEHGEEIFADVRLHPPEFDRLPATTAAQQRQLVDRIRQFLG